MNNLTRLSKRNKVKAICKYFFKIFFNISLKKHKEPWSANINQDTFKDLFDKYPVYPSEKTSLKKRICIMVSDRNELIHSAAKAAIKFFNGNLTLIDPLKAGWCIQEIKNNFDGVIYRPLFNSFLNRQISNEHLELFELSGVPVWPNKTENYLYEGKRRASMYFAMKNIPIPQTHLFYTASTALAFLDAVKYPILLKTDIGASSSGVFLLENKSQATKSINYIFSAGLLRNSNNRHDIDTGYILFQEFIPDIREYRIIKIGSSWFGHEKKGKKGSVFFSGSGETSWEIPPRKAFDFCNSIALDNNFNVMSFDVFETISGSLLLNEAQTWFGSYNPSQMFKNGTPGRFVYLGNELIFEEGIFNSNRSLNLRIFEFNNFLLNRA